MLYFLFSVYYHFKKVLMSHQVKPFIMIVHTPTYIQQKENMDVKEVEKLEQAIEVHGYRGASKKKHNGVVNIKPDDVQLLKCLAKFRTLENKFTTDLIKDDQLQKKIDVKVVAHIDNGNRAVGEIYVNKNNDMILILHGFSNYNYSLF